MTISITVLLKMSSIEPTKPHLMTIHTYLPLSSPSHSTIQAYSKALNASMAAGLSPGVVGGGGGGIPGGLPPSLLAVASHHHSSPPGAHLLTAHPMAGGLPPHPKPSSTYTSPPVAPNEPSCNECRLIEYRGAKIASFQVGGETVICLPQVSHS